MKWDKRIVAIALILSFLFATPAYTVEAQGNSVIDQLVVLPSGDYNTKEAKAMIDRLEKIPAEALEGLNDKGVKIKLTNDIITKEPELQYLKGVTPRGWENTGLTWDDVPGVSEKNVVVRIGYSKKGKGHSSYNLEIHETMHAIDRFVYDEASGTSAFKEIFNKEAQVKYDGDGYVSVYPAEYFAEAATLYVYSDKTRSDLQKNMPLTYDYLDKLFNS
ncbi:anthrax toxin lethal factor-related metalloendopeptidase [Paenibacillus marinisediminis]